VAGTGDSTTSVCHYGGIKSGNEGGLEARRHRTAYGRCSRGGLLPPSMVGNLPAARRLSAPYLPGRRGGNLAPAAFCRCRQHHSSGALLYEGRRKAGRRRCWASLRGVGIRRMDWACFMRRAPGVAAWRAGWARALRPRSTFLLFARTLLRIFAALLLEDAPAFCIRRSA